MTSSNQVAIVENSLRTRSKPTQKLAGNEPAKCPYCGRSGKLKRIQEHTLGCHKRPQ